MMQPPRAIFLVDRFPPLHAELMTLLRGLAPDDWARPTACAQWSVKDITAHLLDTCLRRLSFGRDRAPLPEPDAPIQDYAGLVAFLNALNAQWVVAGRRLSPEVLIELLDTAEPQLHAYLASLDPMAEAQFSVAWAGESASPVWFDIGREYTERWLHQQQIRDAVGAPGLTSRKWLHPALEIFVRALPHSYRDVSAAAGQTIRFEVEGEAGDSWTLLRETGHWSLYSGSGEAPTARIITDQDTAWKLLSKGLSREAARQRIRLEGDRRLGEPILNALAIMA